MALNFDERTEEDVAEVGQIELFTLDGKAYSIPETFTANKLLGFMQELRSSGQEAASVGLLIDSIGAAGYNKLLAYKGLKYSDLKAIFDTVAKAAMGSMEEMTGN